MSAREEFEKWHLEQLNGDPDNCPHKAWEAHGYEAGYQAGLEAAAKVCDEHGDHGCGTSSALSEEIRKLIKE